MDTNAQYKVSRYYDDYMYEAIPKQHLKLNS